MRRLARAARHGVDDLLDFFLDRRCPGCAGPLGRDESVCPACDALVPRTGSVLCLHCLRGDPPAEGRAGGACAAHGSRGLVLAGPPFAAPLASILRAFKFEGAARLAPWVASLLPLPPAIGEPLGREYVLVPVPLHLNRRVRRGYDQAGLLAADASRRWGIPCVPALARGRDTPPQADLGGEERRRNLIGAFDLVAPEAVARRPVLLVDDVVTTGSTLLEAARVLAGADPSLVLGLACSHGGGPDQTSEAHVAAPVSL